MRVILPADAPRPPQNHTLLSRDGFRFELRGGDVVRPLNGHWFDRPYPTKVVSFYCPHRILPFITWKLGKFRGYIGFKAFGVDSPHYKEWMNPDEVYDGSIALCPSFRFSWEH